MWHYVLVIQSKLCSDALVVSLAVGYMLGGVGLVSKVNRLTDEKWNLDGNAPSSSFAESVEPTGPKLSEAKAGAYYLDAVEPSVQPLADAMTVSFSGNLIAAQAASAQAAKALRATAKALRSRTWPDSLTNAVTTIADKAKQADYVASSVNDIASKELTPIDAYQVSEADAYLRHKLGLPAATASTIPLEIVHIEDRGIQLAATSPDLP